MLSVMSIQYNDKVQGKKKMLSLLVIARQQCVMWDNVTRVQVSAPRSKSTAVRSTEVDQTY